MNNAAAYWHVVKAASKEDRANPARLLVSIGAGVARMVLIAAIYKVAYDVSGAAALPYANAIWSMGLYFAFIMGLGLRNVFRLAEKDVVTGNVEVSIVKPLDWRLVKVCQLIGRNGIESLAMMVAFTITLLVLVGIPDASFMTWQFLIGYVVLVILGIVTASALYLTIGLAAFWLNDAKSVFRIVDKFVMIFGGAFVPLALLPDVVQTVVRYSPFGVYGAVTQLFNPGLLTHLIPTLIAGIFWSVVMLATCQFIWHKAQQRIEVNGG